MRTRIPILLLLALPIMTLPCLAADSAETTSGRTIEVEATVETDASTLYRLFSTSAGVRTLFPGADATIGDAVGDEYRIAFDPNHPAGDVNGTAGARILALRPGRHIAFEWRGPEFAPVMNVEPLPTWVEVDLTPAEASGHTHVRIRHHGFTADADPTWDRAHDFFVDAWTRVLERLESRFAATPRTVANDTEPEQLYAFLVRPGPGWATDRTLHEQTRILNHAAYLGDLRRRGIMVLGGRFSDLEAIGPSDDKILAFGALRVANRTVAQRYLDADPAAQAGTLVYELRPWTVSLPAAGD